MSIWGRLFDHAPFLALVVDARARTVAYANPACGQLIGGETLVGRPYLEVLSAFGGRSWRLADALASAQPVVEIAAEFRAAGERRWFDVLYQPQIEPDGKVSAVLMLAQDVSARIVSEERLRQSEQRLEIATRAAGIGVWDWDLATDVITYSPRAREICGYPPDGPVTFAMAVASTHPDDLPLTSQISMRCRDPAIRERGVFDYRVVRPDGTIRRVRASGETIFDGPGPDATGLRFIGTLEDITDQRDLEMRLAASEARLQLALDAGRMAVFDWPYDQQEIELSPALRRLLDVEETPMGVLERRTRYHPEDRERVIAARHDALARGDQYCDFEFRYFRRDGMRWLQVRSEIVRREGEPPRLIGVISDITEQKDAEERLDLMARELDHRANNLLSVIQGTVSLSNGETVEALRETINGRLSALARSHRLLADARWKGAELRRLLEQELQPFGLDERVRLEGPDCSLAPAQAQALGMALHELATNAVKYGALSSPTGKVEVVWSVDDAGLDLVWTETGGPPVAAPQRTGLGTTVIQRSLGGGLRGGAQIEWRAQGLCCRLRLPRPGG